MSDKKGGCASDAKFKERKKFKVRCLRCDVPCSSITCVAGDSSSAFPDAVVAGTRQDIYCCCKFLV